MAIYSGTEISGEVNQKMFDLASIQARLRSHLMYITPVLQAF